MSYQWQRKVDLSDVWYDRSIDFSKLKEIICKRLRELNILDEDFSKLINDLENSGDPASFNKAWDELYSWADIERKLWINTFPMYNHIE